MSTFLLTRNTKSENQIFPKLFGPVHKICHICLPGAPAVCDQPVASLTRGSLCNLKTKADHSKLKKK